MKTIHQLLRLFIIPALAFNIPGLYAQEKMYENQLETVYLIDSKEVVYKNTFSSFNQGILEEGTIKFRKKIRAAKNQNELLDFVSTKNTLQLMTADYLKTIRKAANRSKNPEAFRSFLLERLPALQTELSTDSNMDALYFISRKDTFNGKIDALPDVI